MLAKNSLVRLAPGSLVKLATCILFSRVSNGRWAEAVEVLPCDLEGGSTMALQVGEKVTRRDILFGMLLPSGNDAAKLAARLIGPDWLTQMHQLRDQLGMTRTQFHNPHGRDHPAQRSCARDLALLAAEAFSDPIIAAAASLPRHSVNGRELVSTVRCLGSDGINAAKTASTAAAGACLVVSYKDLIICVLGSEVTLLNGYVVAESDKRYRDVRRIMEALEAMPAAQAGAAAATPNPRQAV